MLVIAAFLCYREYDAIARGLRLRRARPLGYAAGLAAVVLRGEIWLPIVGFALIALVLALRADDLAKMLPRAALLLMGIVYVFGAWKCALPLRERNPHWLMYALLLNWAGDIGAVLYWPDIRQASSWRRV